jgi:nicotinamide mononucleotide transporter
MALRVRALGRRELIGCAVAMALAWPLLGAFLARVTDSDVPWWDAFPTAGSLVGQWLLGRKYVENWPVWLLVNTVSVALFAYKGLWLTVVLYAVFVLLSVAGWRAWSTQARAEAR